MKNGLFDKRIPTLFALLILIVVVAISTILIQSGIFYIGKAAPDSLPQYVSITNVSDSSFTVVFTTSGLTDAIVSMDNAKTGNTLILDDRDKKDGSQSKYYSHHISVPNLAPNTTYVFKLIVGGKEYSDPSYTAKTGSATSNTPPSQNPLFGKVLLPDGSIGSDTLAISQTDNSQTISSVTDEKGEFILPTNSLRSTAGTEYVTLQKDTGFTFTFYRQQMTAKATTTFELAQNLPPVTLQQQYNFVQQQEQISDGTSQLAFTTSQTSENTVSIRRPKEGEEFIDQRPVFSGTSYPNSSVDLLIPGVAQQQILTRADGLWTFQAPNRIPQGDHSITITVTDQNKNKTTDSKKFIIFPLGSQVSESATPSATVTPKPTTKPTQPPIPTSTPTKTPTSPTPSTVQVPPTGAITSTPTSTPAIIITQSPTPTPLPTIYFTPTNTPTISAPGAFENTALLTGFSLLLITSGIILLFAL